MKKSKKKGSVFTLLLKNYILFIIVLILLLSGLLFCLIQNMNRIVSEIDPSKILNYESKLTNQRFDEFPLTKLFGQNSGIVIYDENYVKVYAKGNFQKIPNLSIDDIVCIPEYTSNTEITVNDITTNQGVLQHSISSKGKDGIKTYILDENNNIIYQPGNLPFESLDDKQVKLLSNSYYDSYSIFKHSFEVSKGVPYTMVIFLDSSRPETQDILVRSVLIFLFSCLFICGMVTLLFIHFINKKIKKPLTTLFHEINNFENGEISNREYQGPKEFVEIFDSFDSLSHRLKQSEKERFKLEMDRQKILSDISHDLRTPISVIQGYAKALNDGVIPKEEESKYLEIIENKSFHLNELINTFYEYSKMEHPQYTLALVPTDICNFLRDYIADKYTELEIAGFLIDVDIPEIHRICDIECMSLKRAFDNIVNNSIKHNIKGTILTFSLIPTDKNVRIIFEDNGKGIPENLRDTIFTPFVVGDASRSQNGSGLGLSITKKIIEAHHGTIRCLDSKKGTTFEITLPMNP